MTLSVKKASHPFPSLQTPTPGECSPPSSPTSEASVLHFLLSLLLQGGDLGGLRGALAGVEAVQREELEALRLADGLLQVAGLVQQLLDGVVPLYGAALDHLWGAESGESFCLTVSKQC